MSKLIIIRGNSGCGKTSVAKELQKKFGRNTMLISQDTIRRDILWVRDGKNTEAIPLLIELLKYGRINSNIVILEGILTADYYLPLFESAIGEFGSAIYAYYYDIPFEETLKRHSTKQKKNEFGEKEMREWWNENDYIKIIPEYKITKDISLFEAVDIIYEQVSIKELV